MSCMMSYLYCFLVFLQQFFRVRFHEICVTPMARASEGNVLSDRHASRHVPSCLSYHYHRPLAIYRQYLN